VAFAQAMIGNFDWALKFHPGDGYRDDSRKGLWNVLALVRADRTAFPFVYDFDLSGIVTGRHVWYADVFPDRFPGADSHAAVEVLAQVQRTRSLFDRRVLDSARAALLGRKSAILAAAAQAPVDAGGRANATAYLDAFFDAIASDTAFYGPVVARTDTLPFAGAEGTRPSCGPKAAVPIGSPAALVDEHRAGRLAQVYVLDVFWHWADERCPAIRRAPVWVDLSRVERNYPAR
jgi:hypothetical protein